MDKSVGKKSFEETAIKAAEKNPLFRLAAVLVPGAPAIAGLFYAHAKNLEERRIRDFFAHLAENNVTLTKEDMNDEFVHRYMITFAAVARTQRKEKIKHFARMFATGRNSSISTEIYEELLRVVDDLSVREFEALRTLEEFEFANPALEGENSLQRATKFWPEFLYKLESRTGVQAHDSPSFLQSITRTGCYQEITDGFTDYSGGMGHTTSRYQDLKKLCA